MLETTAIPDLVVLSLTVHEDARGWFKENWHRQKMTAAGLPDFGPVQNNISFNHERGVTRGFHAEPWDKLISIVTGRVFCAWIDLREGPSHGAVVTMEVGPETTVFVPAGVANAYQTLEDGTSYSYLVNQHWSPDVRYVAVDLADPVVAAPWPIPLNEAEISDKDRTNPLLADVAPIARKRTLILGAGGQLGRALAVAFPGAHAVTRAELDITDAEQVTSWPWADYDVVLNAAAYTQVDAAETPAGRADAWVANAQAPATLARIASDHRITLVHYSTDYVFDGETEEEGGYDEESPFAPLGSYGASKAAGDLALAAAPRHYLLRTSWVVGEGNNFVRTMARLAKNGVSPKVVDDQVGRLTFTDDLAAATRHLLATHAPYGTYNVTNSGPALTWADIARDVLAARGRERADVTGVTTAEYTAGRETAPRPRSSLLDLRKLEATGFSTPSVSDALADYLHRLADD
jgi:dTDP-4-dehydrorhamnose 3,5-epimerase